MRDCDGCTLCCLFARVEELNKKENEWCSECKNNSCSIYETRPVACSTYYCEWALGNVPIELKPDIVGVMFEKVSDNVLGLYITPEKTLTWLTPDIQIFCDTKIAKGTSLITNTGLVKLSGNETQESLVKTVVDRIKWQGHTPQI